ncbi:MAG: beta-L-arabinofuranosidase domain-containing protein [Chitinophagaceae bacterium]
MNIPVKGALFAAFLLLSALNSHSFCQERAKSAKNNTVVTHDIFKDLPLSHITPQGWLHTFLKNQKDGLTGNIEVAGYPYNTLGWASPKIERPGIQKGKDWWPYEQVGYYVDGLIRCAYLLKDEQMLGKARKQLQYVLDNQQSNGLLGPTHLQGRWHNWPHAGFFRAYMAEYGVTGDKRIVEKLEAHYLSFTPESFSDELELANLEEICWLYGITGNQKLLDMAQEAYSLFSKDIKYRTRFKRTLDFNSDGNPDYHGVVYLELVKIPAILYMYTGNKDYLATARKGLEKLEKYHQLISGVPSSTEETKGINPLAGHETCNVAVYPWTMGYMLKITGEATWADKLEKAVFNAGIGSVEKDFKSHQYFSCPNQVIATLNSSHLGFHPARMAFLPGHDVECCTGNVNRMMPVYIGQMWLSGQQGGLTAALYGPSTVNAYVGKEKKEVTVTEETSYPFSEQINFTIFTKEPVNFPFYVRIPGWCKDAKIRINGKLWPGKIVPGTFVKIEQTFNTNDKIELSLPMRVEVSTWMENGAGVERGPLVYSLPVQAQAEIIKDYPKSSVNMPAWNLEPASEWNYALIVTEEGRKKMKVIKNPVTENPWRLMEVPVRIQVPARKIMGWKMPLQFNPLLKDKVLQNPPFPENYLADLDKDTEMIELVPYGSTMLRLTVFPRIGEK